MPSTQVLQAKLCEQLLRWSSLTVQKAESVVGLTSELTFSSGTLWTMDTVAVDSGRFCFPFLLRILLSKGRAASGEQQLRGAAHPQAPAELAVSPSQAFLGCQQQSSIWM